VFCFHLSEESPFLLAQLCWSLAVGRRVHCVTLDHLDGDRVPDLDFWGAWPTDMLIRPCVQTADTQIQVARFSGAARPRYVSAENATVTDTDGPNLLPVQRNDECDHLPFIPFLPNGKAQQRRPAGRKVVESQNAAAVCCSN
jgi:hypothetical protein